MTQAIVRRDAFYAWLGPSLLIVDGRGECGVEGLTGYYYREARFVKTLRLEINGTPPWLCEAASVNPRVLGFTFNHPELAEFGGGGTGQSNDAETTDAHGLQHRGLVLRSSSTVTAAGLRVSLHVTNHSRKRMEFKVAWE